MRVERDPQWNGLRGLFEASADGAFTLPAGLVELRGALARVEETPDPAAKTSEAVEGERLTRKVVEAARAGKPLPDDGAAVGRGRQQEADAVDLRKAYGAALVELRAALVDAVSDDAEEIVSGHLRPAHAEVMEQAREAGAALEAAGIGDVDVDAGYLRSSDEARAAALDLDDLCRRYAAVRDGLRRLPLGEPQLDGGWFAELRNTADLAGGVERIQRQHVQPAVALAGLLPGGRRGRLLFLTRPEVGAWLPTPGERDQHYRETFGVQVAGRMSPALLKVG